jgi:hypothetical protein
MYLVWHGVVYALGIGDVRGYSHEVELFGNKWH